MADINLKNIANILEKSLKAKTGLLATLQDIQEECGYLPEEALRMLAESRRCSLMDVYSVATFYSSFRFKPIGRHLLQVCMGTACHVRGSSQVAEELGKRIGVEPGETSKDGEFTLETVNCLGCCAIGPVVVKDGKYQAQVKIKDLTPMLSGAKNKQGSPK